MRAASTFSMSTCPTPTMVLDLIRPWITKLPLLCTLLTLVVTHFLLKWRRERHLPPGPWAWPILGHMPHLAMHKHQYDLLTDWARRYGDVFLVYLGSRKTVIVNGWDRVREALQEKGQYFADRPNWLYTPRMIFKCKGILWSNGATWRHLRKFTSVSLRDLGVGKRSLEQNVQEEVSHLVEAFDTTKGHPFKPNRMIEKMTFNVIWSIVFGRRCRANEADVTALLDMLTFMFQNAGTHIPEDFLPWLRFIPIRSPAAPLIENDRKIKEHVRKQIDKHRETFDPNNVRDYIDLYLKIVHEGKTTETLSEENIFRVIVDLFLAGSESTSIFLTWSVLYLAKFPDVQRKCQEDIEAVMGGGDDVTLADREKMTYVMATISEIQRHCNVVPAIPPHSVTSETTLGGYTLPKDTIVIFNMQSVHHDPKYWPHPEDFNPDRWIGPDGGLLKKEAFIPFSTGPRTCLGEWLARLEIFLVTVTLLRTFTLEPPEDSDLPDLKPALQAVTNHPQPFSVCARRRN